MYVFNFRDNKSSLKLLLCTENQQKKKKHNQLDSSHTVCLSHNKVNNPSLEWNKEWLHGKRTVEWNTKRGCVDMRAVCVCVSCKQAEHMN